MTRYYLEISNGIDKLFALRICQSIKPFLNGITIAWCAIAIETPNYSALRHCTLQKRDTSIKGYHYTSKLTYTDLTIENKRPASLVTESHRNSYTPTLPSSPVWHCELYEADAPGIYFSSIVAQELLAGAQSPAGRDA